MLAATAMMLKIIPFETFLALNAIIYSSKESLHVYNDVIMIFFLVKVKMNDFTTILFSTVNNHIEMSCRYDFNLVVSENLLKLSRSFDVTGSGTKPAFSYKSIARLF